MFMIVVMLGFLHALFDLFFDNRTFQQFHYTDGGLIWIDTLFQRICRPGV